MAKLSCGDGEWLYDLSWSDICERSGSAYYLIGQPLVLETEETPDKALTAISRSLFKPEPT
jgi:hypothetical protein